MSAVSQWTKPLARYAAAPPSWGRHPQTFTVADLSLGDHRDRNLEPGHLYWELCTLARRRVGGKPPQPFLIHAGKVLLLSEDDRSTHCLVQAGAGRLQDRGNVAKCLGGLLLDSRPHELARLRRVWGGARHEYQAASLHS